MIDKPFVSIVIPTYNQVEYFLRECIESAIAQTYFNIEIVISDNHSTNNAPTIISEYAAKDRRIRVVKPPLFLSMSESFLFAFTEASGMFCCYVSSDDILLPNCVEVLVGKMVMDENIVFAHGKAIYFKGDNSNNIHWKYFNEISGVYSLNKEAAERLLNFSYICFGGCMVRKDKWTEIYSFLKSEKLIIKNFLDLLLVFLMFEKGNLFYVSDVLVKVRIENESRNSVQSYLIKDAVSIWNFLEKNNLLVAKIKNLGIDIQQYKTKHFIDYNRALLAEYSQGYFGFNEFKIAITDLKSFKSKRPLFFSIFIAMMLTFPRNGIKYYNFFKRIYRFVRG